ncbi:hypothetical protein [Bradyrhizobium iriomotense]|nr:hypothetical protein [Bradyrhizobium iriomotense]
MMQGDLKTGLKAVRGANLSGGANSDAASARSLWPPVAKEFVHWGVE